MNAFDQERFQRARHRSGAAGYATPLGRDACRIAVERTSLRSKREEVSHETVRTPGADLQPTATHTARSSRSFRLGAAAWLLVGFAGGAVFTYVAVERFTREGPLSSASGPAPDAGYSARAVAAAPLRMTYELERFPRTAATPPQTASTESRATAATTSPTKTTPPGVSAEQPVPGERVLNARPITTVPPDPRDTTREIGKEAREGRERERVLPLQQPGPARGATGFEGREIQLRSTPEETGQREVETEKKPAAPPETPAAGATEQTPPGPRSSASAPAMTAFAKEGAPPVGGSPDSLATRLQATRTWLTASPPTTHTLQLMGTHAEAQLTHQLQSLSRVLDPERLYVFRTVAQGKPALTVVFGSYADRGSALDALAKLPPAAAAYQPVVRTVNGIRAELKRHGMDSDADALRTAGS
jgi:septal ring-binding cell division protein DamX